MSSIKVGFEGKYILLNKTIKSVEGIFGELNSRYPSSFPDGISLMLEETEIRSFEQINEIMREKSLKTVKIKAKNKMSKNPKKEQHT